MTGFDIDRLVFDTPPAEPAPTPPPGPMVTMGSLDDSRVELTVDASDDHAWVVLAQSWNAGWTASVDGESLGAAVLVDGFANGWLLPPSDTARSVVLTWTPQRSVTIALWISLFAGLAVAALLIRSRRARVPALAATRTGDGVATATTCDSGRNRWWLLVAWIGLLAVLAGPLPALGAVAVALLAPRRPWIPLVVVVVLGSIVAGGIIALQWHYGYPPGPDWPSRFTWTAPLVWTCVAAVTTVAVIPDRSSPAE